MTIHNSAENKLRKNIVYYNKCLLKKLNRATIIEAIKRQLVWQVRQPISLGAGRALHVHRRRATTCLSRGRVFLEDLIYY